MRRYGDNQLTMFETENEQTAELDESALWDDMKSFIADFPDAQTELLPGLKWGTCYQLYTPAFWKLQYLMYPFTEDSSAHKIGTTLIEEVVQCILGGYGIPSEMGTMAFNRLREQKLITGDVAFERIYEALKTPFITDNGRPVKYRFANQKSYYIYDFLSREDLKNIPCSNDLELRNWLIDLKGIGPKTASWITRNWLRSERVAILDIHILRAGMITGFFEKDLNIKTQYFSLEASYLNFCNSLAVRPSDMDAIIWSYMKKNNKLALNILSNLD